jgi:hypothetical protein
MAAKTLPLLFAYVLGLSFALLGVPTASAITFNFNIPSGPLGTTQEYNVMGFTVTTAASRASSRTPTGSLPGTQMSIYSARMVAETRMGLAW